MQSTATIDPVLASRFDEARAASRVLGTRPTAVKDAALGAIADALLAHEPAILAANEQDIAAGRANGLGDGLLDRLTLTSQRVAALADAVRDVVRLEDPVGESVRGRRLPNGIRIEQVRVPLGVVGAIYEARPNVTVDIAALAIKSGNAVVLRGGSAAEHTNHVLVGVLREGLGAAGLPEGAVQIVDDFGRDGARAMMHARGRIDVLIPRGSAGLIETVVSESTVPVIETGAGVVHMFLDESAPLERAVELVHNAKVQRPSVCNALETVLVHRSAADRLLPAVLDRLLAAGVTVRGDEAVQAVRPEVLPATDDDYATEHMALEISARVVDDLDQALEHIDRFSTRHTEAIVTEDLASAERFLAEVDAAAVMVNTSTRFTDGGEFGFGAEVGISTQKLHARGPMGLPELTSTKWLVRGDGQVRG
ncbi:gamma-glutamyl phosphate reductase [Agromyces rhizosphaerae]|uniref:Gamma-glutamyl phosphate reductase n=1 Tax=Agromyces rhizosphaerae TaxID=88374 RepID=A0A9W6D0A6_9MICO|nr:glutamate-5-semialdehyde dehydrogenase [Agromyces rhizosphaerae]GLI28880.1 gamma-glutamyl phosphate reductase [Agromyces rhizosphaerae]